MEQKAAVKSVTCRKVKEPIKPIESCQIMPSKSMPKFEVAGLVEPCSVNMLNLRISREFVLNDRWRVIPVVDFFNLTNGQTTVSENNFIDINPANNTYLKPFLTIDPFVTPFGLRFTF